MCMLNKIIWLKISDTKLPKEICWCDVGRYAELSSKIVSACMFSVAWLLCNYIFFFNDRLSKVPDYILMENVKGFETSDTR